MRKVFIFMLALFLSLQLEAASWRNKVELIYCNSKAATSFAIFTDAATFEHCKTAILAYKKVLEQEGLGVYIVSAQWERPEEIKEQIIRLAARKPLLEGMVFIGDIPIVRVRKGQHLTTAFKMNEKTFPINEASVPSDRFYDCPDLKFDFVLRDSVQTNWFYFNLSSTGSQRLNPAYYSARMLVPKELVETVGKDKYELMRNYLKKVVEAHREENRLDKFTYFAGHGYNSDCLTAWRQQSLAFKEHFPAAYEVSTGNTFLNFRQDPQMKFKLFTSMQDPKNDVFMFYEHGAPGTQYINGSFPAENLDQYIKVIEMELRSTYKRIKRDKKEAFVKDACAHFGLNPTMFLPESLLAAQKEDSLMCYTKDIDLVDLARLKMGSRFTMFNACYNGSFHEKGYVAGYHIFNDGKTVVAQGNTVNVLQDKWSEQLIGLLSLGARIGFWQKEVITLESHLIGDPTFRFTIPPALVENEFVMQVNRHLALSGKDTELWRGLMESKVEVLRALGVKQLLKNFLLLNATEQSASKYPQMFSAIYNKDKSMTVRMQALYALSCVGGELFTGVLTKGLDDPYELIRRQSAHWAGKHGAPSLKPLLERVAEESMESQRVEYAAKAALGCFITNRVIDAGNSKVIDELRRLRNFPNHSQILNLLSILQDKRVDVEVRIVLCEVLGWYEYAANKNGIIKCLEKQLASANFDSLPQELREEMVKTLKRLKFVN